MGRKTFEGDYALYKGEEFVMVGTRQEIAQALGVSEQTVNFYSTPSHHNRVKGNAFLTIKIEENDNENEIQ